MISSGLTLLCLVMLLFGAFCGFIRRPRNAFVRLCTLLLTALVAFLLAKPAVAIAGSTLLSAYEAQLAQIPVLSQYIASNPDFYGTVSGLAQMLLAPIMFVVLYAVLKIISWIVFKIICTVLGKKKKKKSGCLGRLLGALVGALCGLVGVVVMITPICGYTRLVGTAVSAVTEPGELGEVEEVLAVGYEGIGSTLYDLVGEKLFRSLTTARFDDDKVCLVDETDALCGMVGAFRELVSVPVAEYSVEQMTAIQAVADSFENSYLLSHMGSALLSDAANAWLSDEAYMGLGRPSLGENVDGLVNGFLTVFSTSTPENIGADMDCFASVFTLLIEHDLFSLLGEGADIQNFVVKLMSGTIIEEFYDVLNAHPRMKPVKLAIADTGMRVMMQSLGLPEDIATSHGALLEDISTVIKAVSDGAGNINVDALQAQLDNVLADHNINLDAGTTQLIADGFADEFDPEELKNLSQQEIIDRLIARFNGST